MENKNNGDTPTESEPIKSRVIDYLLNELNYLVNEILDEAEAGDLPTKYEPYVRVHEEDDRYSVEVDSTLFLLLLEERFTLDLYRIKDDEEMEAKNEE